jgi:sigma-B regulation protein RsbU (phosphoserine phosphatase)
MYTDGLTEALNTTREEFSNERVERVMEQLPDNSPDALCDAMIHAVNEFQKGTRFDDDVCLLAFRWNGPKAG